MLRFVAGLTIGVILGFQSPRYARRGREMCGASLGYSNGDVQLEENE